MADALGFLSKAAFKKDHGLYGAGPAIAYPDVPGATDMAATHMIPFSSESMTASPEFLKNMSLIGAGAPLPADIIKEIIAGGVEGQLAYQGWERLMMLAMGFEPPDDSPAFLGTPAAAKTVTDATNASPIVITTSAAHGYTTDDGVRIASVVGNTAANGDWTITVLTADTFSLNFSSGNGAYTSGGTANKYLAFAHLLENDYDPQDQAWSATEERAANGWSANDRKVRRGQIGFCKQIADWVFNSIMVNKVTLSGNPSEVKIAFELVGYDLYLGDYNSANWTLPAGSAALSLFSQLVAKVGERAGGVGTIITFAPSSFELAINNNLKADDQTTGSGVHIVQPVRAGMQEVTFKLEFPRYNSDHTSFMTWAGLNTELAASLVLTGPQIGTTGIYHTWELYMSSIRAKSPAAPIGGPAPLTQSVDFEVHRPSGSDIFDAGSYHSITTKKDSSVVAVINNAFAPNYLLET